MRSIALFSASGIAYRLRGAPLQRELLAPVETEGDTMPDWTRCRSNSLRWERWGLFAIPTPLLALALKTLKRPA